MPDYEGIKSDGVLEMFMNNLATAPEWTPRIIETAMHPLGSRIVGNMQSAVSDNRYTGDLEESISYDYNTGAMQLEISPKAMRGKWDAGLLLELGTRPIPNAPWSPIKAWADFRGVPGFPILMKIREVGVSPHPFLDRTLERSMPDVENTGQEIVDAMANKMVSK